MTKQAPPVDVPLPHGLDDLAHGVGALLKAPDTREREHIAGMIVQEVAHFSGTATADLVQAVTRFAAWGGDGQGVHAAFHKFCVDVGPWIGGQTQRQTTQAAKQVKQITAAQEAAARRVQDAKDAAKKAKPWFAKAMEALIRGGNAKPGRPLLHETANKLIDEALKANEEKMAQMIAVQNQQQQRLIRTAQDNLHKAKLLLTIDRARKYLEELKSPDA